MLSSRLPTSWPMDAVNVKFSGEKKDMSFIVQGECNVGFMRFTRENNLRKVVVGSTPASHFAYLDQAFLETVDTWLCPSDGSSDAVLAESCWLDTQLAQDGKYG